jgi:hypothetical protein
VPFSSSKTIEKVPFSSPPPINFKLLPTVCLWEWFSTVHLIYRKAYCKNVTSQKTTRLKNLRVKKHFYMITVCAGGNDRCLIIAFIHVTSTC